MYLQLFVGGLCLSLFCHVHFSFAIILKRKRTLVACYCVLQMYCYYKCSVALPHSTMGWSAVCHCGISWSYSLTFKYISCFGHCSLNTYAVIFSVPWINLLSRSLFLEYLYCHNHCPLNTLAVIIFIVHWIHYLSWSLFLEYIFVIIIVPWIHIYLLSYSFSCHGHCSSNIFIVIIIVPWIHLLPWSLLREWICCHGHCSLSTFAFVAIIH